MYTNQVILTNQPSLAGTVQPAYPVGLPTTPIFIGGYPQFQNFHSSRVIYKQGLASRVSPFLSFQSPQLAGPVLYQTILQRPQIISQNYQNQQAVLAQQSNQQLVQQNTQGPTLTNAALEPLRHSATYSQQLPISQQQIYFTSVQATSENQSVRSIPTISQQQKSSYMFQDIKKEAIQVHNEGSSTQINQDNIQTQKLQKQFKQQTHKETIKVTQKTSQYAQKIEKKGNIQKASGQSNIQLIQKKTPNLQLATPVHSDVASDVSKPVSQAGLVSPLQVQPANVQQIAVSNVQNKFVLLSSPKLTQSVATFSSPQRAIIANPISVISPQSRIVLPVSSPQKIVQVLASPSRPKTQIILGNSQIITSRQSLTNFSRVLPQQTSRIIVSSPSARIVTQPVPLPLRIYSPVVSNIGLLQTQSFARLSQSVHIVQAHSQASGSKSIVINEPQIINTQNRLGLEQKFLAFEERRNLFDERLQKIAINTVDVHSEEKEIIHTQEQEITNEEEQELQNGEEENQNEEDEDQNIVEENEQVIIEQQQQEKHIHGKITEEQSQEFKTRLESKYEELHQDNNSTPLSQRSLETPPQTEQQQQQDIAKVDQEGEDLLHQKIITTTTTTTTTTTQNEANKIHSKIFVVNTQIQNTGTVSSNASASVQINQGIISNTNNQTTSLLDEQQNYLAQRSLANQVILNAVENSQVTNEDQRYQTEYAEAQQRYLEQNQIGISTGQQGISTQGYAHAADEEEEEDQQLNNEQSDLLVQQQAYLQARGQANEIILNQVLGIADHQQQDNLLQEQNNYLQARGVANEMILNQVIGNTQSSQQQSINLAEIQQQYLQVRGQANENILNQIQENQTHQGEISEQQGDLLEMQQNYLQARGQANENILAFVQGGSLAQQNQEVIQQTQQIVEGNLLHHESSITEVSAAHTSETRTSTTGVNVVQSAASSSSQTVVKAQTTTTTTTTTQSISGAVQTSTSHTTSE